MADDPTSAAKRGRFVTSVRIKRGDLVEIEGRAYEIHGWIITTNEGMTLGTVRIFAHDMPDDVKRDLRTLVIEGEVYA